MFEHLVDVFVGLPSLYTEPPPPPQVVWYVGVFIIVAIVAMKVLNFLS